MRALLDTSVVLAPVGPSVEGDVAISVVTVAELNFGVLVAQSAADRAHRLRRLLAIQQAFDPLPVDAAVAVSYGELAAAVRASGRQPRARALDLLIAATARVHGATLYTRNASDLVGLEGSLDIVAV